jgi:hypothetical protein
MHGKNVVFAVFAPLVLMAIIAVIVVSIGETLLALHALGFEVYHVGSFATEEANHAAAEQAAIYPVACALGLALVILIGGSIATRLAPQARQQDSHHH